VRFAVLARLSDGLILATHASKKSGGQQVETVKRVLTSGNIRAKAQLTVTVNDEVGTLHLMAGEVDVLAVVTSASYTRRTAYKLLGELREKATETVSAEAVSGATREGELKGVAGAWMKEVCSKFENEGAVDKASAVALQIDEVKAVMEGNINRMLDQSESLSAVENKSEALRAGAHQFQRQSEAVKRVMWWRNFKVKAIIGLLVLCVAGYILIPVLANYW